tara:strand:- start:1949 stop:2323 length:375 start_codon:yes stop_codon:yes gene_type:complete
MSEEKSDLRKQLDALLDGEATNEVEGACSENDPCGQPPSWLQMGKNLFRDLKSVAKDAFKGQALVPDSVQAERLEICKACDWFDKAKGRCNKCGCYMDVKTWLASVECPLEENKKWNKYKEKER